MKCIICGKEIDETKQNDDICEDCKETRSELTDGKGED